MQPDAIHRWHRTYLDGLLADTLPFWFPRSVDVCHGGFLHCVDRAGAVVDTDKSVWAQGRMSWLLLSLYNTLERRSEWLEWGSAGLDFLVRHAFDPADGRMYFHLTREGRPIRKRRYAFSEAFAAIAFAAHARATGLAQSAERARSLFEGFTERHFTPGRMEPKFTDVRPMIGLAPRMIALATAQELRENLGEAPRLTHWIDHCIDEIRRLFVKHDLRCVMENVAPDGAIIDHFDGRLLNPGHAIEGAWFVLREAMWRTDRDLVRLGCDMLDYMWDRGWDAEHGGLYYFRDLNDHPVQEYWHDMKFWWPHNEAVIATLLAWLLTGESKYSRMHTQVHAWAHAHFHDCEQGEWFGYVHRDGRLSVSLKGNLWKSAFHLPRMQWVCARILDAHCADLAPSVVDQCSASNAPFLFNSRSKRENTND